MSVVAVVGLGYVGLPLVVEFGKSMKTIGFDIVEDKIAKCRAGTDPSREIPDDEMRKAVHAVYTSDAGSLKEADYIIDVDAAGNRGTLPSEAPLLPDWHPSAGSVGYVEGFASTFAVGPPRPADDVLTVGEYGP